MHCIQARNNSQCHYDFLWDNYILGYVRTIVTKNATETKRILRWLYKLQLSLKRWRDSTKKKLESSPLLSFNFSSAFLMFFFYICWQVWWDEMQCCILREKGVLMWYIYIGEPVPCKKMGCRGELKDDNKMSGLSRYACSFAALAFLSVFISFPILVFVCGQRFTLLRLLFTFFFSGVLFMRGI